MAKNQSLDEKNISLAINEIAAKKEYYNNRMLQEKKVKEQILFTFTQLKTKLQKINSLLDSSKNKNSNFDKTILNEFQQAEILFKNLCIVNAEHQISSWNLEYFRQDIEEDISKLQQYILPNILNSDELNNLGST